jgi:predicted MPP superfamily phosphohydrolase
MNILHITDFHYSSESSKQVKVVQAIVKTIVENKIKIDLVFFTGDLVQSGSKLETFKAASNVLFRTLIETLKVKQENIIFCPGNHDIDRNTIHNAIKSYVDCEIGNSDLLDAFYKKKDVDVFRDSLKPSHNYNSFLTEFHPIDASNKTNELYSIHYRNINEKKYGIVSLNSSWLSAVWKDDKGQLLIPPALLGEIKKELNDVEKKIILIHHPLYFLKDYNFYGVESFIHNEFDLLFSGHVHKISSISRHSGSNGIFEHVAKASLSSKENLGCSIIEIDEIEENKIIVKELTYIEDGDSCFLGSDIIHTVPCGSEKLEIIAFRKKLFDKIIIEKENANNLLLLKEEDEKSDFLTLYNHPVLKRDSEGGLESKNAAAISLEEMVTGKENFVILGKDKCGKTSLLKRIQIDCLINYSRNGKIPFYFDAKEYESKLDSNFEIEQFIRNYFGISRAKVKDILASKDFLLLVDNYSSDSAIGSYLNTLLTEYPDIAFIVCSEYNLSRTVDVFQFSNSIYDKLFFHDLRRKEIIAYTDKRLSANQKREEIQEKIIQLCKQLELPLNYWTVSLLLLIHNKSSDSYSKNLFSILEICVDEIFGKKQLAISRSRISFDQLKTICAELAKELFTHHEIDTFSATYSQVLNQIEKTIIENGRISLSSREVIEYLITCGILKRKNDNDYYVFRLNGFFEYFLALQMTKDISFKEEILNDDVKYLAFKNQLEIYSGFKRDDREFLEKVFEKTKLKLDPVFEKYSSNKDVELLKKIEEPKVIEDVCREMTINKALTSHQKAEIEDLSDELQINAEVHAMKKLNPDEINSELIERYLSILSRSFRNLDAITGNKESITQIFKYIIDSYCDFGFYVIDEFADITKTEISKVGEFDYKNSPELELLKFISNFSPIFSQIMLFEGLGHFNLERMIKSEIKVLEVDPSLNQYKLFMHYFLLLDIDLNGNKELIQRSLYLIKIPILKYIIFVKLNYYLAFKSGSNRQLEKELSNLVQKAKLNLDNKSSISDIHRHIQEKKRVSIINKHNL